MRGVPARAPRVKICGITRVEDAELRGRGSGAWARRAASCGPARRARVPARRRPARIAAARCAAAPRSSACSSTRRSTRSRRVRRRRRARRSSSCTATRAPLLRRGRAAHRGARDQGAPRRAGAPTCAALERLPHRLPPARRARRDGLRGGTGQTFDWALLRGAAARSPADPQRRADARERRRRRSRAVRPSRSTWPAATEAAPGRKDPDAACAAVRAPPSAPQRPQRRPPRARVMAVAGVEHRFGPYGGQYVPETLMPALAELEEAWLAARDDPAYRAELDGLLRDYAGRPTPLYRAERLSRARRPRGLPQARGPHPHRRAQAQQRARPGAARPAHGQARGSSPRPARASTASPPRRRARCSASSASSTWAPRTCAASGPTSSGWSCWARASSRSRRARGR